MREILRRRPRGLTLSRNLMCYEAEWGLVAGAVDKIVTSWMGIGLPWGLSRILREYVESGRVVFEEWSHLGLGLRFRAAAMGLPFLPTLTMLGSDLMDVGGSKTITCPYTGETLHAVPALYPDVSLIHVHRADRFGNCQIDGYPHMDADLALAASTVLVTAEEIVSEDEIRRHPDRTVIPSFAVDALVHVPYGSYPHECYGLYDSEPDHFGRYVDGIKEHGAGGVARYLDRYVYGPATHAEYLDLFGDGALDAARDRAQELASMTAAALSTNEMLAVLGSRALRDGQTVFTGVGAPMLATALAQRRHAPRLTMVVEGGIVGPQWRPGWLPISTNEMRAAYRAQMLPAITDIFLMAQRGFLDVGFIGGAQIDRLRQPQHERHRRLRAAEGPAARQRRRQRHHLAVQRGHHPHRARAAPLRRPGRLHHEPGIPAGRRLAPAERARVRGRLAPRDDARHLRLRAREPAHAARGGPRRRDGGGGAGPDALRPRAARARGHDPAAERRRAGRAAGARPRAPVPRRSERTS